LLVYSYKIEWTFNWDPDWSRDLYDIARLVRGDFQIIGPTLAGGLYAGPYYYWILAPLIALSNFNEKVVLIGNAWFFALAVSVGFSYTFQKYGLLSGLLTITLLGLNPFWVSAARHPWNGTTYLPLLLIVCLLIYFKNCWKPLDTLVYGFLWGILLNFHPATVIVLIPLSILYFHKFQGRLAFVTYFTGVLAAFGPLVLFEIKNGLPITKGLLIYHRFANFSVASNPSVLMAKGNFFENVWFMLNQLNIQTFGLGLAAVAISFILVILRTSKMPITTPIKTLIGSIILVALIVRNVFGPHYLYPVSLLVMFTFALYLSSLKSNKIKVLLLVIFIILDINLFHKNILIKSTENGTKADFAVRAVINQGLIKKDERFAVMGVKSLPIYVPYGHEYRYYFVKNGYKPQRIQNYSQANKLVVFSEMGSLAMTDLRSWETDQFGLSLAGSPTFIQAGSVHIQVYEYNKD
jgi:hypothetical protein